MQKRTIKFCEQWKATILPAAHMNDHSEHALTAGKIIVLSRDWLCFSLSKYSRDCPTKNRLSFTHYWHPRGSPVHVLIMRLIRVGVWAFSEVSYLVVNDVTLKRERKSQDSGKRFWGPDSGKFIPEGNVYTPYRYKRRRRGRRWWRKTSWLKGKSFVSTKDLFRASWWILNFYITPFVSVHFLACNFLI